MNDFSSLILLRPYQKIEYSKFLTHTRTTKIGVCFNVQLFEQVPHDDKGEVAAPTQRG